MGLAWDISRCVASNCAIKEQCARFMDKGEGAYRLSVTDFSNTCNSQDKFALAHFIPIRKQPSVKPR